MVAHINTVAFAGIEAKPVDVQVQVSNGMAGFTIVGLPDKAVGESRERVRSALAAVGLALPPKRITVNLSPADLPKEGSHYDLPIALGLMAAMEVLDREDMAGLLALGELSLDGKISAVPGVLPAAIAASGLDLALVCPAAQGGEAAWAGDLDILAAPDLLSLVNHLKGSQILSRPEAALADMDGSLPDLRDIKGQELAKRALEIAAAGGHNLLMMGPPGSGKSMLAARLPSILPPLSAKEALEVSMVASVAGMLDGGAISRRRPFRSPHHSASMPALVGGGARAKPGEVSLAHMGVLFLDELPEFPRATLESLRQPIETGKAVVSRAMAHVTYPARFQLVAAMNPCRCGHLDDAALACARAPRCAADYQAKISGPLFDRIDLHIDVPAVSALDLTLPPPAEGSADVAKRVAAARTLQRDRFIAMGEPDLLTNAQADGDILARIARPDEAGRALLEKAIGQMRLSARGYHRILRVARTLADMDGAADIRHAHIAEALSFRRIAPAFNAV
ncbi:ATPase AAA [Iodidimonas muriae]|uniref:ATPase AAA n=1 Tax=Iodidimonas muriae TaxID=261467 RepID=A0ABQ2L963_9PROT|nr:YifB family Mg chelatase-like AAA ATPase [Iodidimonas muriae]GGO07404.1 ATPase AAA [Iodidimonas muriae]